MSGLALPLRSAAFLTTLLLRREPFFHDASAAQHILEAKLLSISSFTDILFMCRYSLFPSFIWRFEESSRYWAISTVLHVSRLLFMCPLFLFFDAEYWSVEDTRFDDSCWLNVCGAHLLSFNWGIGLSPNIAFMMMMSCDGSIWVISRNAQLCTNSFQIRLWFELNRPAELISFPSCGTVNGGLPFYWRKFGVMHGRGGW